MYRCTLVLLMALFSCSCLYSSANQGQQANNVQPSTGGPLDGVYEFVSEITNNTSPKQSTVTRNADEWKGLWFFQSGHFSKMMVKNNRPSWTPGNFPSDAGGTGFEGASGTFVLKGEVIELNYMLAFYPGMAYAKESISFRNENGLLTLTRTFGPSREALAEGEEIIVLRRLSPH